MILPTYNEADNIVPLIADILRYLSTRAPEVLVVDDQSPDGTADRVRGAIRKNHWKTVRILVRTKDRGLTNSIRDGIRNTNGSVVVWMDCDFSHPPSLLPQLIAPAEYGYDAAVGSRFVSGGMQKNTGSDKGDSVLVLWLSTVLNRILGFLFRFDFHDYTSGYIAVKRSVLSQIPPRGDYGEYFIDFMVRFFSKGYRVVEIPYHAPPRRFGVSKTGTTIPVLFRHGIRYVWTVCRIGIEQLLR